MTASRTGRHAAATRAPAGDPLSHRAMQQEIESNRRAEYRLLIWTATSLCAVAILIVVHLLWL
jgi:hypothetical protein